MADHTAIAAVSRSLRTLLRDRMVSNAAVTLAPPDIEVAGVEGARVNLYLFQVIENAHLANQEIPGTGHAGSYGRPPLALGLRYLLTTHSAIETSPEADLNAQTLLGDAMRVLHFFGNRVDALNVTRPAAGTVGDPILDPALSGEYERIKLRLDPGGLDDLLRIWSALPQENFRRAAVYEATVVQIETTEPARRPRPVQTRRINISVRRRPVVHCAYVTPTGASRPGEMRVRIGDEITIETDFASAERVYVRLGRLDPIRLSPSADGRYALNVPDAQYPADLDQAARPIDPARLLQPGLLEVQVIAVHPTEGVAGGPDRGTTVLTDRSYRSNIVLMQLVPQITAINPLNGNQTGILTIQGTRLWTPGAREAIAVIGDAVVRIRPPVGTDPWAAPASVSVQVPLAEATALLPVPAAAGDTHSVAVEIDGARSRDPVTFRLDP